MLTHPGTTLPASAADEILALPVATFLAESTRDALKKVGYKLGYEQRTSGPVNAIEFDTKHQRVWSGSSNHGEDYGVTW